MISGRTSSTCRPESTSITRAQGNRKSSYAQSIMLFRQNNITIRLPANKTHVTYTIWNWVVSCFLLAANCLVAMIVILHPLRPSGGWRVTIIATRFGGVVVCPTKGVKISKKEYSAPVTGSTSSETRCQVCVLIRRQVSTTWRRGS